MKSTTILLIAALAACADNTALDVDPTRAALDGKQVVVLTPTTVLCQQHFENFEKRFKDHPVRVDMLSRFCTPTGSAMKVS